MNVKSFTCFIGLALLAVLMQDVSFAQLANLPKDRPVKIMAVGDSITDGLPPTFHSYRYPLMSKLADAGYSVEFVGTKTSHPEPGSPFKDLAHEGYAGKNIDQIFGQFKLHYPEYPADIVLMHCGHNQSAEQNPVPGMIERTREFILLARQHNPKVVMLVAQVIPSGKLPKYSYIPDYNKALPALAAELNTVEQPVILVDQETGFDPDKDAVGDKVHPTAEGAKKMAQKWFEALQKILPSPVSGATG